MKIIFTIAALGCLSVILADDVRLVDLDPPEAQQHINSKDQTLKYAPKVESSVPATRFIGNEPQQVLEDIYLANQYHGQDGLGGYIYGYSVPDIAKTEKKEPGGDLKGAYNYISGDGQEIKVEYWDDGNGFHQIDNVPQILPKQVPDSPEVQAAKDEHARIWAEEAERNSKPIENPYPDTKPGAYAGLGAGVGAGQGQNQPSGYQGKQYNQQGQPQGGQQPHGGQYQQNQGQGSQGQGQYKPQGSGSGAFGQNQYQPQGQAQGGAFQGHGGSQGSQQGASFGQNKPNNFGGSQGQNTNQYQPQGQGQGSAFQGHGNSQGSQPGASFGQNKPNNFGGSQGQAQNQYKPQNEGSFQGNAQGPQQGSGFGQQGSFGQNKPNNIGQGGGNFGQGGQGSYGGGNAQGSGSSQHGQQTSGGPGQGNYQHGGAGHQQGNAGQYGGNGNDYSGQQTENKKSYAKNPQEKNDWNEEENKEEQGPPKGFFYNFDYPVGIIVSKQGGGNVQNKRESLSSVYSTNKALFEQQLKGGAALHGGAAYPSYQVHA